MRSSPEGVGTARGLLRGAGVPFSRDRCREGEGRSHHSPIDRRSAIGGSDTSSGCTEIAVREPDQPVGLITEVTELCRSSLDHILGTLLLQGVSIALTRDRCA